MTFKDKAKNYFNYSLLAIPTVLFFLVLSIGNNLIESDMKKVKEDKIQLSESTIEIQEQLDLNNKINWCNKRTECIILAETGYHEARGETDQGIVAVMFVAKNRKESNHSIFRNQDSIRKVVYAKSQFSYVTDGSKDRGMKSKEQSDRVKVLAYDVMNNLIQDVTDNSLYFNTPAIYRNPEHYAYTYTIGNHIFYKHPNS